MTSEPERKKLKEKLAKFAGFKYWDGAQYGGYIVWTYPDGSEHESLPDFFNDSTACLKWFAPLLAERRLSIKLLYYPSSKGTCTEVYIYKEAFEKWMENPVRLGRSIAHTLTKENPAEALCEALGRMIDKRIPIVKAPQKKKRETS